MKLILPIIIVLVVITGGYFAVNQFLIPEKTPSTKSPTPSPVSQELKIFQSELMKFSVSIPNDFSAEEKFGGITIFSAGEKIFIDKNGTNFGSLVYYLNDLSVKNEVEIKKQTNLTINGLEAVAGFIDQDKNYYIYTDNSVFLLSTTSESLYDDLDQIAQSFRYTP